MSCPPVKESCLQRPGGLRECGVLQKARKAATGWLAHWAVGRRASLPGVGWGRREAPSTLSTFRIRVGLGLGRQRWIRHRLCRPAVHGRGVAPVQGRETQEESEAPDGDLNMWGHSGGAWAFQDCQHQGSRSLLWIDSTESRKKSSRMKRTKETWKICWMW